MTHYIADFFNSEGHGTKQIVCASQREAAETILREVRQGFYSYRTRDEVRKALMSPRFYLPLNDGGLCGILPCKCTEHAVGERYTWQDIPTFAERKAAERKAAGRRIAA